MVTTNSFGNSGAVDSICTNTSRRFKKFCFTLSLLLVLALLTLFRILVAAASYGNACLFFGPKYWRIQLHNASRRCSCTSGGEKKGKGIVTGQNQPLKAVWCNTRLLNSGGQFDQTCNLFGGAIPAQGLC